MLYAPIMKKHIEKKKKIIVGLLLTTALVLGYIIISREIQQNPVGRIMRMMRIGDDQSVPTAVDVFSEEKTSTAGDAALSVDETAVLNTPGEQAMPEERKAHFDLALRLARESSYLDIGQCRGSPVVLRISLGGVFAVRNSDSVDHEIVFNAEKRFSIPAGGTLNVTADFGKGAGLYGYGCDTAPKAAGMVLVSSNN